MTTLPATALSVRQPSAWALIHGGKDIENRTAFSVKAGGMAPGRIAIHAALGMTRAEYEYSAYKFGEMGCTVPRPDALIRGAIIGVVTVTAIITREETDSPWMSRKTPDMRGLLIADPVPIDPIPATGARGYFEWVEGGEIAAPAPWMESWGRTDEGSGDLFSGLPRQFQTPPKRPWG